MTSLTGARGGGPGDVIPSGYRKAQLRQFTPEQMNLFQQMFGVVGPDSYLSKLAGGDQSTFEQMEAPALRQFSELQGNIASRFSNMGSGARRSSGFQNTMNSAASNFAQELAARRGDLQRQALMDMSNISNSLLNQRPYEQSLEEKRRKPPSFLQSLGMNFANSFAEGAGNQLGSNIFGGGIF